MIIIDSFDIQDIIVSYLNNEVDLLAWRHTCSNTMRLFTANFICNKFNSIFNVVSLLLLYDYNKTITNDLDKYGHNLVYLSCGYNNSICKLDKLINLTTLKCEYNKKIKHLPKQLHKLSCGWNDKISDNDISKLTQLRILHCDFNTKLTSKSISCLYSLECIDLGVNTNVTDETFKNLTKLKHLTCGSNNLTDIALSYLPNLEYLNCKGCSNFTDIGLSYIPKLKKLNCGASVDITDEGFKHIPQLTYLNCDGNYKLTDRALQYVPMLKFLDCGVNKLLTDNGIIQLVHLNILYPRYNKNFSKKVLYKFKISYTYNSYISYYRGAKKN